VSLGEKIQKLTRQLQGPIVRYSPFEVDVSDHQAAQRIHRAKDGFLKTPFYSILITDSSSVFNEIRPEIHRRYKRLLSGEMSETGLKKFLPRIDGKVRLAIQRMEDENKSRGLTDIAKWLMFLSFDVIGDLTFGESFGNLERGEVCYIKFLVLIAVKPRPRRASWWSEFDQSCSWLILFLD
jgi:cytochrome P450